MQSLTDIGKFFGKNAGTIVPGALTGFGFLNNLFSQNRYNRQEDLAYNLAKDPAKAARYYQGFERPLTAGLTQGVENQVQAALGERGLTLSPAISAAAYAQALAPFIQNQQRLAAEVGMGTLGAGTSFPQARGSDVSGPLQQLMQSLKKQDPNDPTNTVPTDIGAPTLPYPGMDPSADPSWWLPDPNALPSSAFQAPWTDILGGFSPAIPSFSSPDLATGSLPSYSMPGGG